MSHWTLSKFTGIVQQFKKTNGLCNFLSEESTFENVEKTARICVQLYNGWARQETDVRLNFIFSSILNVKI